MLFISSVRTPSSSSRSFFAGLFNFDSGAGGDAAGMIAEILDRLGHAAREPEVHADEEDDQNDDDYRGVYIATGDEPYRYEQQRTIAAMLEAKVGF